jgi:hypothetical protein
MPKVSGLGQLSQRLMAMDDDTWARHCNPWSGWSRVTILPLLVLAAWSRLWIGWWFLLPVLLVGLWAWANPRVFPPPASTDHWMSRGVLGERLWLAHDAVDLPRHHRRVVRLLSGASAIGALVLLVGLVRLDPLLTLLGLTVAMLTKLWFLDRMVWLHEDLRGPSSRSGVETEAVPPREAEDRAQHPRARTATGR